MKPGAGTVETTLATNEDLPAIVQIHQAAFPGFLMTVLGRGFLMRYYKLAFDCRGGLILLAREIGQETLAGFAVGYAEPKEFYRRLVGARIQLGLAAAFYAVFRPWTWLRIASAFRRARSASVHHMPHRAELASLAVRPECGGRGIGQALVERFVALAGEMGATEVALTTDADNNERVIRFYQKLGFVVSREVQVTEERRMVELVRGGLRPQN